MQLFTTWTWIIVATAFLGLAQPGQAQSSCKGLSKGKCGSSSSCTWVKSYKTQKGNTVAAYCRAKGSKGAAAKSKPTKTEAKAKAESKKRKAAAGKSSSVKKRASDRKSKATAAKKKAPVQSAKEKAKAKTKTEKTSRASTKK